MNFYCTCYHVAAGSSGSRRGLLRTGLPRRRRASPEPLYGSCADRCVEAPLSSATKGSACHDQSWMARVWGFVSQRLPFGGCLSELIDWLFWVQSFQFWEGDREWHGVSQKHFPTGLNLRSHPTVLTRVKPMPCLTLTVSTVRSSCFSACKRKSIGLKQV